MMWRAIARPMSDGAVLRSWSCMVMVLCLGAFAAGTSGAERYLPLVVLVLWLSACAGLLAAAGAPVSLRDASAMVARSLGMAAAGGLWLVLLPFMMSAVDTALEYLEGPTLDPHGERLLLFVPPVLYALAVVVLVRTVRRTRAASPDWKTIAWVVPGGLAVLLSAVIPLVAGTSFFAAFLPASVQYAMVASFSLSLFTRRT